MSETPNILQVHVINWDISRIDGIEFIEAFGRNDAGQSVCIRASGFRQYFYVEFPQEWIGRGGTGDVFALRKVAIAFVRYLNFRIRCTFDKRRWSYDPDVPFIQFDPEDDVCFKKKFWGFTNDKLFPFCRLNFRSRGEFSAAKSILKYPIKFVGACVTPTDGYRVKLHDSQIDGIVRFFHHRNIEPSGWVRVDNYDDLGNCSKCDMTVGAKWSDIYPIDRMPDSKIVIASFDIECVSQHGSGSFPIPTDTHSYVTMIGTVLKRYGEAEPYKRIMHSYRQCDDIPGVVVRSFDKELDMLLDWAKMISDEQVDITISFNGFGFDWNYIYQRVSEVYKVELEFLQLINRTYEPAKFVDRSLSTSARGDNKMQYVDAKGRLTIDMMKCIQWTYKLNSYSLNACSAHFIGDQKDDIDHHQISQYFHAGSDKRAIVGAYCIKDCELTMRLMDKLQTLTNDMAMSNVCCVPLSYMYFRGQSPRALSLVTKTCLEESKVVWDMKHYDDRLTVVAYDGATVLEPICKIHNEAIAVFDFQSLYPSLMIEFNLSHDTLVMEGAYDNLEGVEYHDRSYVDRSTGQMVHARYRKATTPSQYGILPKILMKLLKARADARLRMKTEKDPFRLSVLDSLQNSYKVVCNSVYGQTGAPTSHLYEVRIAAVVTASGREKLITTRDRLLQQYPGSVTVYGDTDSLFMRFVEGTDQAAFDTTMKLGEEASKFMDGHLNYPHKLNFEKIMWPLVMQKPKRYFGVKWERKGSAVVSDTIYMGTESKRRDNANIVKIVLDGMNKIILDSRNIGLAKAFVRTCLKDLLAGKYPLEDLVVTKSLRANYKNEDSIAHKVLAKRMVRRDPGMVINSNDRIPYVFIPVPRGVKEADVLQGERIEHPDYIRKNNIKPDYIYYVTNQIQKPVLRVLELADPNADRLFEDLLRDARNERQGMKSLKAWFS